MGHFGCGDGDSEVEIETLLGESFAGAESVYEIGG